MPRRLLLAATLVLTGCAGPDVVTRPVPVHLVCPEVEPPHLFAEEPPAPAEDIRIDAEHFADLRDVWIHDRGVYAAYVQLWHDCPAHQ